MTRHGRLRTKEELGLPKWVPAVEGSFDDPPIVLRQDRLKLWLLCLGCLCFVGMGWVLPPERRTSTIDFGMWLFGSGAAFSALLAMFPAVLVLDPAGLTIRSLFRTRESPWSDFDGFREVSMRGARIVVGVPSAAYRARSGWRRFLAPDLGVLWEVPTQRVVDVLNEARARWGPPSSLQPDQ